MVSILAFDPSGNSKEGSGTTGWVYMKDGDVLEIGEIKASTHKFPEAYWLSHLLLIDRKRPDEVVMEGYKLYHHKGQQAEKQAHSELETPQLIGAIKMHCYQCVVPLTIQWASQVKSRWSDEILIRKGVLEKGVGSPRFNGEGTNPHKRDAIRHALHYWRYGRRSK